MQKNTWIATLVGFLIFLTLGSALFLTFKTSQMGGYRANDLYRLQAKFDDISGLGKQARIMLSGVQVGRVDNIHLDPTTGEAIVDLYVQKDLRLPVDSSAQILTSGLLGERYVALVKGASQEVLKEGDTLKRTGGAVVLEKMIQQFLSGAGDFYPESSYIVTAKFNDITGIAVGTPIRMAGVQVGRVKSIRLDQENFQAVLEFEIAKEFSQIPIDSSADIVSTSLIGGKYIALMAGGETEYLKAGSQILTTSSSIVLERVIQQVVTSLTSK